MKRLLVGVTSLLLFTAAVAAELAKVDFAADDIQDIALEADAAWLRLTPAAAADFRRLTEEQLGNRLSISVEGVPATEARVFSVVDTGVVQIASPSPEVRERLAALQRQRESAATK